MLDQISIPSGQTDPLPREKKKKNLNTKQQQQKRYIAKSNEHQRGGRGNPSQQAGWRRQKQRHTPSNQGAGKLVKVAVGGKLHRRGGKTHFPCEM
jgi:hypothetical protein